MREYVSDRQKNFKAGLDARSEDDEPDGIQSVVQAQPDSRDADNEGGEDGCRAATWRGAKQPTGSTFEPGVDWGHWMV
jgi:hypothetical protein